jgi:hypothetical protein
MKSRKQKLFLLSAFILCFILLRFLHLRNCSDAPWKYIPSVASSFEDTEDQGQCASLVVRTQLGIQSKSMNYCRTPKGEAEKVCLPMCGTRSFTVNVADNAVDDTVKTLKVGRCQSCTRADSDKILVVFRMTRVFNGFHMYHVLNNFIVNLNPRYLDRYVFHCWGEHDCPVKFSTFFDKALNLNSRMVNSGCYSNYVFLGEHYTTYNVDRQDAEKYVRWREWAAVFKKVWCPTNALPFDDRYFTHLDRRGANNGRNMHHCELGDHVHTRYIVPSLENIGESMETFCNSRVLFSAEGNGLTNMLLLPTGSTIVVLWQSNRHVSALHSIYGNMAKLLGMTLVPIPVNSDRELNANCSADLNLLLEALF